MAAQSRTGRIRTDQRLVEQLRVNLGATTSDGYDSSKEFYARGHQIPNADRNGSDELVVQTYYATNSTPQIQNKFNGGIWQQLESGVRNIAATTDTVYVVTGAILQTAGNHEAITWITPKSDSKRCPYRTITTKRC